MAKFIFAGLFIVVVIAHGKAEAADLYVNNGHPSCSDSTTRAGNSSSTPWCTIGRAAWGSTVRSSPNPSQAAQAGDTVYVLAGIYTTTGTVTRYDPAYNPVNTGTAGSPITFEAVGTVILRQSESGPLVGANGNSSPRNYITWRGFTIYEIDALASSDTGPVVLWSTTGSRIENFVIDGYDAGRLGNNHNGIRIENTTNVVLRNNKIYNVLNFGTQHINGAGIMAYFSTGAVIEHNEIYNCGSGIFIKGINNNFTVRYNEVYDTGGGIVAMYTEDTGAHRIYQNIVRSSGTGVTVSLRSHRVRIVNNTLIGNGAGILLQHWAEPISDIVVQNNIIQQSSGEQVTGWDFNNLAQLSLDRNNYHGSQRWSLAGVAYTSVGAWRSGLGGCPGVGNDCAAVLSDPMFVDAGSHNYRLQPGSPARNIGVDVLDLNNNGSTTDTISAGAYVTGAEVIGRFSGAAPPPAGPPSPPTGVRIVQ